MNYPQAYDYIINRLRSELQPTLSYHGLHHTLDVLASAESIASEEKINGTDLLLLKTAAAYHDCGFLVTYQQHEEAGCEIARKTLLQFGYGHADIDAICSMIMATRLPQAPATMLEKILCDADLDYLGRDDFDGIAATLFQEFRAFSIVDTEEAWNKVQVNFLSSHVYHTAHSQQLREPAKRLHLEKLREVLKTYA
jgi:putative nucleotidyltransferase with HDIG domain